MAWNGRFRSWSDRHRSRTRPRLWPSILFGFVVFALVWTAGRQLLGSQPVRWSAQAAVVILPDDSLDTDLAASYYSTLSQGQIVNTYAEILRLQRFQDSVTQELARRTGGDDVGVSVEVVADTSMITIGADASKPRVAERFADGILGQALSYVEGLPISNVYELAVASQAAGNAEETGVDARTFLAVLTLVAVVAGIAAQQVWQQTAAALRVRRLTDASAPAERRPPPPPRNERGPLVELWGDGEVDGATQRAPEAPEQHKEHGRS